LKSGVGALTAKQGLQVLAEDEDTRVIVLVSKPPAAEVVTDLLGIARRIPKPVIVNFIGYPPPARQLGNLYFATSLQESAELALKLADLEFKAAENEATKGPGYLRGLFSGGTLALEAVLGLQNVLSPLYSNVPLHSEQEMADPLESQAHSIVDLGEDIFTVGRLHPMIDNDLRIRRMQQEAADPEAGIILLDVVLGEGAHPDPAAELAPAIEQALKTRPELEFLAVVLGTDDDPQNIEEQITALEQAGSEVFRTVSEVVEYLSSVYSVGGTKADTAVSLGEGLAAVNLGLESFYQSLKDQGAQAVQVDWRPPAGGNEKLMDILAKMKK
jgi:FdrA protein